MIALNKKYFNSTQNYTLALLNAFDNLYYYVQEIQNDQYISDNAYKVPITFGNYEKSAALSGLKPKDIKKGNYNIIPRLVLTFNGMRKAPERQTQKYQMFKKTIQTPDGKNSLEVSYNSIAYDFNYTLLLQARGMTMATQLTEQILSLFNPSMNLNILEFPLFTEMTQTQIKTEDPEFEIIETFEDTDVNIINVIFNLTVRGNIYSQIGYSAPVEVISIFTHVWDEFAYEQAKLSSYYKYDLENSLPIKETSRIYNGTKEYTDDVYLPLEEMKEKRPDFEEPEIITNLKKGF